MGKYLKKFENHTQYDTYINGSGVILPNVSICTTEGGVYYSPYVDPYNGYKYVDLDLPSGKLWACYNIGASSELEYGDYYQYGKGASKIELTKEESDYTGLENPLATSADTAAQIMGGNWRTPTKEEFEELINNTTHESIIDYDNSGINVTKYSSKKDSNKYIIFPWGGSWSLSTDGLKLTGVNSNVYVASSTPYGSNVGQRVNFIPNGGYTSSNNRKNGYNVRGIIEKQN